LLTDSDSKRRCGCFRRFGSFSPFLPFLFVPSVCFFFFCCFRVGPSLFPFLFSLLRSISSFSLLRSISSLSLLCFFFVFSFFPSVHFSPSVLFSPLSSAFLGSIYRGQGRCFFTALTGSSRLVGHWARLPRFGGWCAMGGRPLCPVGGLQAREWPAKIQKKASLFLPSSPLHVRGGRRKMNSVVQNDTVLPFPPPFFFLNGGNGVVLDKTRRFI